MGLRVKFWGTRGSIPSPGPDTIRVGGNTTCLEIINDESDRIIIDAGTGIRNLGRKLIKSGKPVKLVLLLTHSHWDHLSGFTFFAPAFIEDNEIDIYGNKMAQEVIRGDFFERSDNRYSPVNMNDLRAQFKFFPDIPSDFKFGKISIQILNLNHPGNGFAYRFDYKDSSFAFITDNEIGKRYEGGHTKKELIEFCSNLDVLIHDAQFLPSELDTHKGWGHSTYKEVIDVAKQAGISQVYLTHHDPERSDEACNLLLEDARSFISKQKLNIRCDLAIEGDFFNLD